MATKRVSIVLVLILLMAVGSLITISAAAQEWAYITPNATVTPTVTPTITPTVAPTIQDAYILPTILPTVDNVEQESNSMIDFFDLDWAFI